MTNTPRKQNQPYKGQADLNQLNALLGEEDPISLPLTAIVLPESQPRRYFDPEKLAQLAASIKAHGILENLLVRPLANGNDKYELVAGERRYQAATAAGLSEVPVTVRKLSNDEAIEIALIENLQREDLNPLEETEGMITLLSVRLNIGTSDVPRLLYQMLNQQAGKSTNNVISNEQIEIITAMFTEMGRMTWESFTINRLALLKLPEDILGVLRQGKIEYTKAREIAKLKDEALRAELLKEAIADSLSLKQIRERLVKFKPDNEKETPKAKIQEVSQRLNKLKLWEKDKKTWKKVEGLLNKIENIVAELESSVSFESESSNIETITNGKDPIRS